VKEGYYNKGENQLKIKGGVNYNGAKVECRCCGRGG